MPSLLALSFALIQLIAPASSGPLASDLLIGPFQERIHLQHAREVANWLDTMATPGPSGNGRMWRITEDESLSTATHLYSGTSGVVLFYLQLFRVTQEPHYLEQARLGGIALCESLNDETAGRSLAFWIGDSGVAYVLYELSQEVDDPRFSEAADQVLERLVHARTPIDEAQEDAIKFTDVTDVIGGNAGIGLFLLYAHRAGHHSQALVLAEQTADGLIAQAQEVELSDESRGLKWMMSPDYPREMPNYSHGTAGVVAFLSDLHVQMKEAAESEYDGRFLDAAKSGAHYLNSIAIVEDQTCLIAHHFPADGDLFYLGWCHGPTGTAPVFERLADVTGNDRWTNLANEGTRAILRSGIPDLRPSGFWNNHGLCCGSAGVASFLLDRHQHSGDEELKEFAYRLHEDLMSKAERMPLADGRHGLRWVHAENRVQPDVVKAQTGFMQGAAGIGLWLLKLDAFERGADFPYALPIRP